jgi:hypothetical protein
VKSNLRLNVLSTVALSALVAISAACVGAPVGTDEGSGREDVAPGVMRMMPITEQTEVSLKDQSPVGQAAAGAHLTYYGGPVIQHVNVIPVYWNSTVANQASLNTYYSDLTNSTYFDWLSEYNTASPAQSIGRGTAQAGFVDSKSTTTTITDAQIHAELNALFTANKIPQPNANNYYAIHFPKNAKIKSSDGTQSCVVWCAYHGTYVRNGQNVYYGVLPDVSSTGCAGGCGGSTAFNNETSVSSHELIEAVTDAAVGIATTYAPPLAWYDQVNGEIGDICNGQQATITANGKSYTVQKEWSNSKKACVTQ